MPDLCQQIDNNMTQKKLWEDEIPNWLEILDRLEEVKKEDADTVSYTHLTLPTTPYV